MANFKTRISKISKINGKIILANDYDFSTKNLYNQTLQNIRKLNKFLCGIKLNFHVILPLGFKEILKINNLAHQYGLQTIADIKLNDIGNTNRVATETLSNLGFDAIIVNPIMGLEGLKNLILLAHKKNMGIITLCHMSAPEAKLSYDLEVGTAKQSKKLFQLFLDWAIFSKADGIIAGATFPEIIKICKTKAKNKLDIYSPGIGTQGGSIKKVMSMGSDYLIVGRSILNSKNPVTMAKQFQNETLD